MSNWAAIVLAAAEIIAAAPDLVGFARDIRRWFENVVSRSGNRQAQRIWEDFKRDPEGNREALAQVVTMQLNPDSDPVLRGYVLGVARQKLQEDSRRTYNLLSSTRYTFEQVQDMCARMDPKLNGLGRRYSKQEAAQWAVTLAGTKESLRDILVSSMLEINPDVVAEVVR